MNEKRLGRKNLGDIGWEDYEGYSCRAVSIDDSVSNVKVVQFYAVSNSDIGCLSEHLVIDRLGNIVHYGIHGFDKEDYISKYDVEFNQQNLKFIEKNRKNEAYL